MDADKPVPVENLPPVRFIGDPTGQGRTVRVQGSCEAEREVAVITMVGVPVEEALDDIGI